MKKTILIGVTFVFVGMTYYAKGKSSQIRNYLEDKYGRGMMDAVGYGGGALQLMAVTAVSRGWLSNTSTTYHAISLIGSTGLLLTAFYHDAMAPVLVNIIWMGMNTVGIFEGVSNMAVLTQATSILG